MLYIVSQLSSRKISPCGTHFIQIQGSCKHLIFLDSKLRGLHIQVPIHRDQRTAVKIDSIAITTLVICIDVDASKLGGCVLDKMESSVEFSQGVVGA